MRGVNDDEIVDFAAFGREQGVGVRFIEFMPLDAGGGWQRDEVVTQRRDRRSASTPCSRSSPVPTAGARAGRPLALPRRAAATSA